LHTEDFNTVKEMYEVCDGKRFIDEYVIAEYEFGDDKKIGRNLQNYKA
jgi:hypothetical protein